METVKVKICGIKSLVEALVAVEAGADLLGFNFYLPSPRYIAPKECANLVSGLQNRGIQALLVGVFVNEPVDHITRLMDECGLDAAQLSGDEPPEALRLLDGRGFKSLRVVDKENTLQQASLYARPGYPPALLVDSYHPGFYGGTGQPGDWGLARSLAARYPLLLAGGLHPGNVTQAICQVHPWGVDVASGVESSPGRKDFDKMRAFIQAARHVYQEVERC